MLIDVVDAGLQTLIFAIIFAVLVFVSIRKKRDTTFFSVDVTHELKGFAILAIVLSHIGYFLSTNTDFLFPFSVLAGVGVDLFLFLSGFGLSLSAIKKPLSPFSFFVKRVTKIFIPLWIVLACFFLLDWLFLHQSYPFTEMWQSFLGFFAEADLFHSVDSPLWFITLIVGYYLAFPWFFKKEHPYLSALLLFFGGYFFIDYGFEAVWRVNHLYRLHYMALPLGVAFAGLYTSKKIHHYTHMISSFFSTRRWMSVLGNVVLAGLACVVFFYFAVHSGVGRDPWLEQIISNMTMLAIVILFVLKPFDIRFLGVIGVYSYEIYLLHWPILYRYDMLYTWLPAGIATALYIVLFWGIGFVLQWLTTKLIKYITSHMKTI